MKLKNLFTFAIWLSAGILTCSCSEENATANEPEAVVPGGKENENKNEEKVDDTEPGLNVQFSAQELSAAKATGAFSYNFFRAVSETSPKDENVVVSPLSAQILLSMLANTTKADATCEITDALGCSDLNALNSISLKYITELPKVHNYVKMALANAVWYDDKYTINPVFAQTLSDYYNSTPSGRDFSDPQPVVDEINRWCAENTNGLIDNIINDIPAETVALLANALYFKDQWCLPFDEEATVNGNFNGATGICSAKMMNTKELLSYTEGADFQAVNKMLSGLFSVWFVLPTESISVDDFMQQFNPEVLNAPTVRDALVDLTLPRFSYTSDKIDLNNALTKLGITSILQITSRHIFTPAIEAYSDIKQKTTVSFDEKGIEASAVTWDQMSGSTGDKPQYEEKTVTIDRPFLFFIMEERTGACLMAGKIVKV